ncbi:unnamed protein product [Adineta ricciae]|uniref:Cytochrome P450 n=1 Tax=Adineta ricciae TaxID=249248 RepID=A0A815LLN2_ADIRI|nr:unnamed protein product [Adineta ricciae]CAF1516114.1 unnamed protein product [Adineta ricciae]
MIIVISLAFVLGLCLYLKYYYFALFLENLPCMRQQFLFGNILQFQNDSLVTVFAKCRKHFGETFALYYGPSRFVHISKLEHVAEIFSRIKIYERDIMTRSNTNALLPRCLRTLIGTEWQTRKRIVSASFRSSHMLVHAPNIVATADLLIDNLRSENSTPNGTVHMSAAFDRIIIEGLLQIFIGYSASYETTVMEFSNAFLQLEQANSCMFSAFLLPIWFKKAYIKMNKEYCRAEAILYTHMECFIGNSNRDEKTLLNSLIEAHEQNLVTKPEIFSEVFDILSTAYSFVRSNIRWFLHYLSDNEHVQTKIKQELADLSISYHTIWTMKLINKLIYTECVCKEILRHSPGIAPYIARTAITDGIIEDEPSQIRICKGDTIVIGAYNIHHDSQHWKLDPYRFLPERFLNEDRDHERNAFIPFGGGDRACIARQISMVILKIILVRFMLSISIHRHEDRDSAVMASNLALGQKEAVDLGGIYIR